MAVPDKNGTARFDSLYQDHGPLAYMVKREREALMKLFQVQQGPPCGYVVVVANGLAKAAARVRTSLSALKGDRPGAPATVRELGVATQETVQVRPPESSSPLRDAQRS